MLYTHGKPAPTIQAANVVSVGVLYKLTLIQTSINERFIKSNGSFEFH